MNKLILFDIDGTLITAGGAGTRSMNLAFKKLFGIDEAFARITMAGKTDIQIMKEGLKTHNFPYRDGNVGKITEEYIDFLKVEINNPARSLKHGVKEALVMMKDMDLTIGLLTGNLRDGARIKLGACGIDDYFIDGAFGSDHEDRDKLLPIAIDKFSARGFKFLPENCVVIGDTPRDVQCAKIHGARCIAVATGPYSMKELLTTKADVTVNSLSETAQYMDLLS
jgi:phosphoglycolate phosphatase-like HAD superfamily hydrolase